MARPGSEIEYTYSTPSIWSSSFSRRVEICRSTSATGRPGASIQTSAIGTTICGSSSRGVSSSATAPPASEKAISSAGSGPTRNRSITRPRKEPAGVRAALKRGSTCTWEHVDSRRLQAQPAF